MKGGYHIIIQDKRMKYDFYIKRNITIIKGESATGKTQLMEKSKDTYLAYKKIKLNENYLKDNIAEISIKNIPERVKEIIGLS